MWHDPGPGAAVERAGGWIEPGDLMAETPATKRRMRNLVEVSGLLEQPRAAPPAARDRGGAASLPHARVPRPRPHALGRATAAARRRRAGRRRHLRHRAARRGRVPSPPSTPSSTGTPTTPTRSSGRPATTRWPTQAMGFCIFGNVALAAAHARQARGLGRVAVVDWDVHHGNGTQLAFWDDPSVLTISLHQDRASRPRPAGRRGGRRRRRGSTSTSPPARVGHRCLRGGVRARRPPSARPLPAGARSSSRAGFDANAATRSRGMMLHAGLPPC